MDYCCERMAQDLNRVCPDHRDREDCPDALIAEVRGGFALMVHDGSGRIVAIDYCPFCGTSLPMIQGHIVGQ